MKTIKEQLCEAGFDCENTFIPEELDMAFIGIAETDWHYGRSVYDLSKLNGIEIPKTPEGLKEPIFMTLLEDMDEYDLSEFVRFAPEGLDAAINAITEDGQVVYDYDNLLETMMNVENWSYEEASEWISFNTLRDYSYRDEGPVVYINIDYMIE